MQELESLFQSWAGEPCLECLSIGANGSNRRYYRLRGATRGCMGAVNPDVRENEAFFAYSRHFHAKGVRVPELYAVSAGRTAYLQQDLGDQTLYGLLREKKQQGGGFDSEMTGLYRRALADLAGLQQAGRDLDFSVAYPRPAFDRRSILWDLNYFKYNFLKLAGIAFDEELLENDFQTLADFLLGADCTYFLYRDFQSRNIMLCGGDLYYIDYQGGRQGAAQYDVASLLYSAKSDLPEALRQDLLRHYLDVRGIDGDSRSRWMDHFWGYVVVRIMQAMGAYGYRGLFERKPYFIESIPLAVNNLRAVTQSHPLPVALPELQRIWQRLADSTLAGGIAAASVADVLTVTVQSFSYKRGLPDDPTGNGGGFIFDCRALPNPGRYPEYKTHTGKDRPVLDFFADPQHSVHMRRFLDHVEALIGQSVDKYLERHFANLSVAFGCTGGQHRSVYCAEQTARWLAEAYPQCRVVLRHREQD